ncbi:MAG TPA: relaxase/mobilization nuclease domain-containing protein [Bilophila wadsworthia]|uniref:DNA-primase RepB domain-containing protein n=1 Tax=Bilophila wadsworthia TaxID=35833 RepID=UPI001D3476BC|nr:DNA-primase RepB domain-containing protein [Bilophila wadsworthia]HJH15398.1 relaxase/mobilization nuclease domain-containing protein [Bilophila wadsworthia]
MIVKKIKNTKAEKPKAWQIGDLVDYIRFPHNKNPLEKIEYAGGRGFLSATHTGQKMEMIALARESAHSNMPVQHWMFSWQESEQPTREQVEELVDIFLERMGLTGHQTVYGLHYDTDNYHLHIAVNRMNPESGKVVQPHRGFDIREAHKIVAFIEHKQGWASEENSMYTVLENGELARRRTAREIKPKQAALDFEHATGEKSAQRIAQERGHDIIKNARSWAELHEKLAGVGLRFEKKGSGAVIFVGDIAVKASSVDRAFSMGRLCKKWGEFEEGSYSVALEKIAPEPVSSVNLEEWKVYQKEFAGVLKKAEAGENVGLVRMKERHRFERKRALSRLAKYGLPVLNIARHCLTVQQKMERLSFHSGRKKARGGKPRFENWLRIQGMMKEAARWRYRTASEQERHTPPAPQGAAQGAEAMLEISDFRNYAAAVNADRYRVTCIKMDEDGGKKAFILDKKGGMSRGFTPEELEAHIPEMLRFQKRGENIYYTPLSDDRHHILIDDMSRDSLKRLQEDGFRPAVVLESSPGNYQCLLTIPKLGTDFDRDVGNRITERLNREYGDKKLCGCIHPHRAPGFENRKPKHRREDGSYPQVRLLFAERRECGKALTLARRIDREYAEAAEKRKAERRTLQMQNFLPGEPVSAYYTHLENIRRHLSIEDYSRVDAMIALRMRANGHSRESVEETIRVCAPTIRDSPTGRNWQRYAERTVNYAFGPAGDRDLERNARYRELWEKIEYSGGDNCWKLRMR